MKISYNWLKDYLEVDLPAEKTAEILTDLGLEVEGIERIESVKGGLKGLVAGKVLTCVPHPNADKLSLTTVDLGDGNPVQIVCGAPNVAEGQKVAVATVGTVLYDRDGKEFKIKKSKIRGEESYGMICAEDEIGLGDSHDGILVLDDAVVPGTPLSEIFEVEEDTVFEIGLTPNRSDAMSHFGVARDLNAGLLQKGMELPLLEPSVSDFHIDNHLFNIGVDVENNDLCRRYFGLTINEMTVKESPQWLQNRLRSIGLKPINNVVDVTNFVMHELGQPLHAFDAQAIKGKKIVVKTLPSGTRFTALDGSEIELHEEDIMICDAEDTPLCIAGVYGGLHSGVTEDTTEMFLESAAFNPVSIRKTAKRHDLHTDASFRFERGIDIDNLDVALKRAATLIVDVTGGKISSSIQEYYPVKVEENQVLLHYRTIDRLVGQSIPKDTVKTILMSLDIKVISETEQSLGLSIPHYRTDVTREADVVEEILRVYGYNNVAFTGEMRFSLVKDDRFKENLKREISSFLNARGFYEMMSNSLTKEEYTGYSEHIEKEKTVPVLNPLSKDLSVLRPAMIFGALESVAFNINRKTSDILLYEWGKIYEKNKKQYSEKERLTLTTAGYYRKDSWMGSGTKAGFFYLKGLISDLFRKIGWEDYTEEAYAADYYTDAIVFRYNGKHIAELGVVNPALARKFGIKTGVCFAEIDLAEIEKLAGNHRVVFRNLPKYPAVKRDMALVLDKSVVYADLYRTAFETEKNILKSVRLFDVYEGDKIPEGKKSYALSFVLQDDRKTLKDKQIDKVVKRIFEEFVKRFQAELRK